jgi:hypothetical protein
MWVCNSNRCLFGALLAAIALALPVWTYNAGGDYSLSGRISVVLAVFILLRVTKQI